MANLQKQKRLECEQCDCQYLYRCEVYHGNECRFNGGERIPRFGETRHLAPRQEVRFRPYFVSVFVGEDDDI